MVKRINAEYSSHPNSKTLAASKLLLFISSSSKVKAQRDRLRSSGFKVTLNRDAIKVTLGSKLDNWCENASSRRVVEQIRPANARHETKVAGSSQPEQKPNNSSPQQIKHADMEATFQYSAMTNAQFRLLKLSRCPRSVLIPHGQSVIENVFDGRGEGNRPSCPL